jgi:ABC-2 type transport system permease protein
VTPLIFGIIYAVLLLRQGGQPPAGRGEAPLWFMMILSNAWVYGNVGLSLFVGWMLQARLAGMAFSQEGRKYWLLKTAPVSAEQLLAAKFIVAYLPTLGLSGLFLIVISILQRAAWQTFLFTLPALALVIAGNAGLNLAFGVLGANMDWEDPRQMQRGGSGCLGALASMIYLPVSLLLIFGPPLLLPLVGAPSPAGELAGLLLGGVFSLVCAILTPWLVRRRVEALGESG